VELLSSAQASPRFVPSRRRAAIAAGFLVFALLGCSRSGAEPAPEPPTKEYQVKAAFLFNFTQFVQWPESAFRDAGEPICIGVLGEDPFGKALDETVGGERSGRRDLIVRRSRAVSELKDCQLLFISKSERGRLAPILSEVESTGVLTVSEVEGFARLGGTINFYLEGNRVRFEINPDGAQKAGLRISSQLLSLGKIVASGDPGSED
jgi:hypothetical protein